MHAFYIEGQTEQFDAYKEALKPFWARKYERFGVDEARELTSLAGLKNIADRVVYFLGISSITTEAQQALLKLLEEPQQGTTFILLVPHGALIATVRSRMLPYPEQIEFENSAEAKKFLKLGSKERSDYITKFLKDDEEVKERARDLVNGLEVELFDRHRKSITLEVRQALEDIAKVRDYLRDRSPSIKMLLEHLALCLPKS